MTKKILKVIKLELKLFALIVKNWRNMYAKLSLNQINKKRFLRFCRYVNIEIRLVSSDQAGPE